MGEQEEKPVRLRADGKPRAPGKRGGARPGAGRKPKPKPEDVQVFYVEDETMSMLEFLRKVALGHLVVSQVQVAAARTAVQYEAVKTGDGGKGEARQKAAKDTADELPSTPAPAAHLRRVK